MKRSLKTALHALAALSPSPFAVAILDDRGRVCTLQAPRIDPRVGATALTFGRAGVERDAIDDERSNRQVLVLMHADDEPAIEARDLRTEAPVRDVSGARVGAARLRLPCALDLGDGVIAVLGKPGAICDEADVYAHTAAPLFPRAPYRVAIEVHEASTRGAEFVEQPPVMLGFSLEPQRTPTGSIDLTQVGDGVSRQRIHGETIAEDALVEGYFVGRSGRCDWPSCVGERFRALSRLQGVIVASQGEIFYCDTNSAMARERGTESIVRLGRRMDVTLTPRLHLFAEVG